ncbi:peroxiredoxin family protein [Arcticibacterium luteifluviistationis]|uniref:Alkyl hydroperoxide reductase n=1 Tax=Arcticibacterium luteifluviistationis TaxID=1784714 RepID=A0A2Z4GEG1_9BACT|nr:TlpA disulfide reductase family protein [Arcticibacterium luteifluviistationis]AWV99531.1 alkyl hydroperoxide reductase [Arcticibacterium luteifluviistationis]
MRKLLLMLSAFLLWQCQSENKKNIDGVWRAEVPTLIGPIPFNLEIETKNDTIKVYAINADEKLELDNAFFKNDSLHITMEVFDAEIVAHVSDKTMHGIYTKKLDDNSNRTGAFSASMGDSYRFTADSETAKHDVSGKWQVSFTEPEGKIYPAVGIFSQKGNKVTGTFLTSTGDYRFLDGNVVGDSLKLSCFDGTHIFLFKAKINENKLEGGRFSSSLLYKETWEGVKDDNAKLPDPDSLTFIKAGFDKFELSFKNTKGETISLSDAQYKDKVVLVQILGSWCPNCMDESKFYVKWLKENPEKDVEIIGLAFEKSTEPDIAYPKIDKMKKRFGMEYEVLLAGTIDKEDANKSLPMLNHIMSYPTTIYLDKKHHVRKIHTGFSGPGTGEYYAQFTEDFERFMELLISEE